MAILPCSTKKCEQPFEPNPNLRLLLKEQDYHLLNPVWAKSGWIYYLKIHKNELQLKGEIWKIYEDGRYNQRVIDGEFIHFDLSESETLMAALEPYDITDEIGKIWVINLNKLEKKVLPQIFSKKYVRFLGSDTLLLIYFEGAFEKINLLSYEIDTIYKIRKVNYFTLYKDSLLYFIRDLSSSEIYNLHLKKRVFTTKNLFIDARFSKYNPEILLVATGQMIYNWVTSETKILDMKPYKNCKIRGGDWNDIEDKIVFSVSENKIIDGELLDPFEIWILDKL